MKKEKRNQLNKTWEEYDREIAFAMKNYFLIKVSQSQYKTAKSMWRKGHAVSDIVSYIILSSNPIK